MDGDGMFQIFEYKQISQDEAKQMMEKDDGHVIVDVRREVRVIFPELSSFRMRV